MDKDKSVVDDELLNFHKSREVCERSLRGELDQMNVDCARMADALDRATKEVLALRHQRDGDEYEIARLQQEVAVAAAGNSKSSSSSKSKKDKEKEKESPNARLVAELNNVRREKTVLEDEFFKVRDELEDTVKQRTLVAQELKKEQVKEMKKKRGKKSAQFSFV